MLTIERGHNRGMGIALWLGGGLVAFLAARLIPLRRPGGLWIELIAALVVAGALGLVATALDFGGWREPDWRAGVFAMLGAFAAAGLVRAIRKNPPAAAVAASKSGGPS
jgi:hypothetical protein